jgi:hypothetical protein
MKTWRRIGMVVILLAVVTAVRADERKKPGVTISDKSFRQISSTFLNDPRHRSAGDWSRLILLYAMQTSNAAVVLGSDEMHWVALDPGERRSLFLLAAYAAGNIQSQLNSGVKRNDRYSGLLTLFRVYRVLQAEDAKFKILTVDHLLSLHREDKLLEHLRKLDEKKPTKLNPAEEEALRMLMDRR